MKIEKKCKLMTLFSYILIFCFPLALSAQETENEEEQNSSQKHRTTSIYFANGNIYGWLGNSYMMKLNDGGCKPIADQKLHPKNKVSKKTEKGKWVISENNSRFQFSHERSPNKMAHYKDESVIIAGLQSQTSPGAPSYVFINRSKDGGKSWHRIFEEENSDFMFYQIAHPSPQHIVALAEKFVKDSTGNDVKQLFVLTSSDTGTTWVENSPFFPVILPGEYPKSLNFNGQYGMLTLTTSSKNELWYTSDYGLRWLKKDLPSDLSYSDGKVLGDDKFYLSNTYPTRKAAYSEEFLQNGNWQFFSIPENYKSTSVAVINGDTIWSATGKPSGQGNTARNYITSTTNSGQSWNIALDVFEDNTYQRNGLTTIAFANSLYGAATGLNVSYLTEDGGKTWVKHDLLESIFSSFIAPQSIAYYRNPVNGKNMLLTLLNSNYVLRYDFDAEKDTGNVGIFNPTNNTTNLNIYPNPASTFLNVEVTDNNFNAQNYSIKIISMDGRVISNNNISTAGAVKHTLPIDNLSKGTYILQVVSNTGISNKLFIKE